MKGDAVRDGFEAMGEPVPFSRKSNASEALDSMGVELDTEAKMDFINTVANAVERDEPNEALAEAREVVDVTGAYRLLATLCVDN